MHNPRHDSEKSSGKIVFPIDYPLLINRLNFISNDMGGEQPDHARLKNPETVMFPLHLCRSVQQAGCPDCRMVHSKLPRQVHPWSGLVEGIP